MSDGMRSPYTNLPPEAFWRSGVVDQPPDAIPGLYRKKFAIGRTTQIATAGSCFAQHIARQFRSRGFSVIDVEPPPPGLTAEAAGRFGYGLFSARYANIYTARQLRQIAAEAFDRFRPEDAVWEKDGRFYDAMRPSVEPNGLSSPELVMEHRQFHLRKVANLLRTAEVFIFTFGLTEAWTHAESGTAYPTAPGTIAGSYDPGIHVLKNYTFNETYDEMRQFFRIARRANPNIRFLLTVSPVPMTATATGRHVLVANTYTKSLLRTVAGQLAQEDDDVDYFPGYEMVAGAQAKGAFYADNLRHVRPEGVATAMAAFFAEHDAQDARAAAAPSMPKPAAPSSSGEDDAVCEDILLDAFAP